MKQKDPKTEKKPSTIKNSKQPSQKGEGKAPARSKKVAVKNKKNDDKGVDQKKYYEAIGRRKSAIARVRLFTSSPSQSVIEGNLIINEKNYKELFPILELQKIIEAPLVRLKSLNRFRATIKVSGGGKRGQAEAIRHGIARALVLFDGNFRKKLKKVGYLTRDPRKKERKKYGLKKARRRPQWSKR